jgi:hypothetical protein
LIQKPYEISLKNAIVDASIPMPISWKTSGDTSASFSISIYNNADDTLTWTLPRTYGFAMSYTIPALSIPNGAVYKITITVWNSASQTATSQLVVFTASSTPTVVVPTIDTVGNHSYLFSATYSQSESDLLSSYIVNLYNANQTLWKTSGVMLDGLMEYRFDLMKNNETYFIEFIVTSKKGLTASSGLIQFTVVYDNPSMYFELTAETVPEKASVKLNWKIKQVIGKTNIAPIYIANDELDVRSGKVFYDEGFGIENDFTLKIWFREIVKNVDLIYLKGLNGEIRLQYENDNSFHLYKKIGIFTNHYMYPISFGGDGVFISPYQYVEGTGNKLFLCIVQKNARIDIFSEVVI